MENVLYVSSNRKHMVLTSGRSFAFNDNHLVLKNPTEIDILDSYISRLKEKGIDPHIAKVVKEEVKEAPKSPVAEGNEKKRRSKKKTSNPG